MLPVSLTIAGSDPSGGAGIQADLKTFHQFGVYGEAVITLITVQNSLGVMRVECLSPDLVYEQLAAVLEDIPPQAAKTGALGNAGIIEAIAAAAADFRFPLVIDPVMVSKHGAPLLPPDAARAMVSRLLPHASLVTPNIEEARALTGLEITNLPAMREAGKILCGLGAAAALVKGGHMPGDATDVLVSPAGCYEFPAPRVDTRHTHGTGCTYSAGIAAELARGSSLDRAVALAKRFISEAIRTNPGLGRGSGPVNHLAPARSNESPD